MSIADLKSSANHLAHEEPVPGAGGDAVPDPLAQYGCGLEPTACFRSCIVVAGETVTIRPIQINDLEMQQDFIRRLSPTAKHFRFLGGVSELPSPELRRLCDVDGKYSIAFVATVLRSGREVEVGVVRYAPYTGSNTREMAVTVADEWQHRGLGTTLVKHLIETAKVNGVTHLYSVGLVDNRAMAALAKNLGMVSMRDPSDPHQVICSLVL